MLRYHWHLISMFSLYSRRLNLFFRIQDKLTFFKPKIHSGSEVQWYSVPVPDRTLDQIMMVLWNSSTVQLNTQSQNTCCNGMIAKIKLPIIPYPKLFFHHIKIHDDYWSLPWTSISIGFNFKAGGPELELHWHILQMPLKTLMSLLLDLWSWDLSTTTQWKLR